MATPKAIPEATPDYDALLDTTEVIKPSMMGLIVYDHWRWKSTEVVKVYAPSQPALAARLIEERETITRQYDAWVTEQAAKADEPAPDAPALTDLHTITKSAFMGILVYSDLHYGSDQVFRVYGSTEASVRAKLASHKADLIARAEEDRASASAKEEARGA